MCRDQSELKVEALPGTRLLLLGFAFFQPLSPLVGFNFKTHLTAYQFGKKCIGPRQTKTIQSKLLFFLEPEVSTLQFTWETELPHLENSLPAPRTPKQLPSKQLIRFFSFPSGLRPYLNSTAEIHVSFLLLCTFTSSCQLHSGVLKTLCIVRALKSNVYPDQVMSDNSQSSVGG